MLRELAFRLAVEETPFIQSMRNNVIVAITPVLEVDGRDKPVDTFYYAKNTGKPAPPPTCWGRYVAHDNKRDAIGQALPLPKQTMRALLEWPPTVLPRPPPPGPRAAGPDGRRGRAERPRD